MPERVTPEERLVSIAIEKARKAKEELTAKKRENIEPTQIGEVEHEAENAKLKRPKAQADNTKIKTQSEETHSGYGLAGQEMKKAKFSGPPRERAGYPSLAGKSSGTLRMMGLHIKELSKSPDTKNNIHVKELVILYEEAMEDYREHEKYGTGEDYTGASRTDEQFIR
jgi:hypothetical protein